MWSSQSPGGMSESYIQDLRKVFDLERKVLLYSGFYPNKGRMNNFLYLLSRFYHLTMSVLVQLSMIVLIALHIENLSTVSEALMFFMTQQAFLCKLINFLRKSHQLTEMENILANPLFYRLSTENNKIITKYVEFAKWFGRFFRTSCFLVCATSGTLPLLGIKNHTMLLGWNPWENNIKYYINCIFQLTALCISASVNSSIDMLTNMLIVITTAQIEILKNNLVSIDYKRVVAKHEFNENVRLHYEILRLFDRIEDTFSFGLLSQIFSSVLVICFTSFQMVIVSPRSLQFFILFIYFTCMMTQIASYCWFGHYLITSSDTIIESVYMSNWYEAEHSLKRSIIIFMENCKRPIVLRPGNLFSLSLVTFTSVWFDQSVEWLHFLNIFQVMRSAYSYLAVLRRLYDPETERF